MNAISSTINSRCRESLSRTDVDAILRPVQVMHGVGLKTSSKGVVGGPEVRPYTSAYTACFLFLGFAGPPHHTETPVYFVFSYGPYLFFFFSFFRP